MNLFDLQQHFYQPSPYQLLRTVSVSPSTSSASSRRSRSSNSPSSSHSSRVKIIDYLSHLSISGWLDLSSSYFSQFVQLEEFESLRLTQPELASTSQECDASNFWSSFVQSSELREEVGRLDDIESKLSSLVSGQFYYAFNPRHFSVAISGLRSQYGVSGPGSGKVDVSVPEEAFKSEDNLPVGVRQRLRLWRLVKGMLGVEMDDGEQGEDSDWDMDLDEDTSSGSDGSGEVEAVVEVEDSAANAIFHSLSLISTSPFSSTPSVSPLPTPSLSASPIVSTSSPFLPSASPSSSFQSLMARKFGTSSASQVHSSNVPSGRFVPNLYNIGMDFRIIRSNNLRALARGLFSEKVAGRWCRIHRLKECRVCLHNEEQDTQEGPKVERSEKLFSFIADFVILSAHFIICHASRPLPQNFSILPAWYTLMADLLTASVLELYLVDKLHGTNVVEVLLGVGVNVGGSAPGEMKREAPMGGSGDDDEELARAAEVLFGGFTAEHADYTRCLLERTHEILDVPVHETLESHFEKLSLRYPLSSLIFRMRDFFGCASEALGRPDLAQSELMAHPINAHEKAKQALATYMKFD